LVLEQEIRRILDPVLDRHLEVHDVLIPGQHLRRVPEGTHLIHVDLGMLLDGQRQPPMGSGLGDFLIGAELQHHAPLGGFDDVNAGSQPYCE
jgi:hypothetical protein